MNEQRAGGRLCGVLVQYILLQSGSFMFSPAIPAITAHWNTAQYRSVWWEYCGGCWEVEEYPMLLWGSDALGPGF